MEINLRVFLHGFVVVLGISLLVGCQTFDGLFMPLRSDDFAMNKGIESWNAGNYENAVRYWSYVENDNDRNKYLNAENARVRLVDNMSKDETEFETTMSIDERLTEFNTVFELRTSIPEELRLPRIDSWLAELRVNLIDDLGKEIAALLESRQENLALTLARRGIEVLGPIASIQSVLDDIAERNNQIVDKYLALRRDWQAFRSRQWSFEQKIEELGRLELRARQLIETAGYTEQSAFDEVDLSTIVDETEGILSSIGVERTRSVRDEFNRYSETIGRLFSQSPRIGSLDSLTPADIDRLYAGTLEEMNRLTVSLVDIATRYPNMVDSGTVRRVEAEKREYEGRISRIRSEVRTRVEQGTPVVPPVIGLFNAESGYSDNNERSRPAVFSGLSQRGVADWWWGNIEANSREFVDLVVESRSEIDVDVYAQSYKENDQRRPNQDLVSGDYAGGGYWPVLNAASRLDQGRYSVRIEPEGRTGPYDGEAVVYRAFVSVYY